MEIVIGIIIGLVIGFVVGKLMEAKTGGEEKTQLIAKVQVLAANIEQDKLHHASEMKGMKESHASEVHSLKAQMENERLHVPSSSEVEYHACRKGWLSGWPLL